MSLQGQLVYLAWSLTEGIERKNFPVLVLDKPDQQGDIKLLKVTGKADYDNTIAVTQKDLVAGSLKKTIYIRTDRCISVHQSQIEMRGVQLESQKLAEVHRALLLWNTRQFSRLNHLAQRPATDSLRPKFSQGKTIPYAGRVFEEAEVEVAVSTALDFWLTLGQEGQAFEQELAQFLGVYACLVVNSGSSANLIALSSLSSPLIEESRRLLKGDEVITCAAGFPTTVAPILQNGCVPVFIDNDLITGNVQVSQLEKAYIPGKTKAVMIAHALGNPFDIGSVLEFCRCHDLWLIEDNCDALGCSYSLPRSKAEALGFKKNSPGLDEGSERVVRWTGTWGDISTQSFYPPHHLTMGEGGAVNIVRSAKLKRIAESFRDWGRDCWCPSGKDNTCGKRYDWQLGELPEGYDHKYIYSHLGYNLKPLDLQAAIGRVQLQRLPQFIEARKQNWQRLRRGLADLSDVFEFSLPTHAIAWDLDSSFVWDNSGHRSDCSWFGFLLLVKPMAPFRRADLARHLEKHRIGTRMLFGGNLLRQPVFVDLRQNQPESVRVAVEPIGADRLMHEAIFLGTYPGLGPDEINFVCDIIRTFVVSSRNQPASL